MSSPTPSDISQNNTEIFEKQWQEMQWRHKEKEQLLLQLEKVTKLHWAKCMAQKARREVKKKAKEEAKKQLERIRAVMEQRWYSEGENGKKKSGDKEKGSKDGPRESREERTLSSVSC